MEKLLRNVEKELEKIADKGISSSNLDTTYKLIDIYKDIKESCYYDYQTEDGSYNARMRDGKGRYMQSDEGRYNNSKYYTDDWNTSDRYNMDDYNPHTERMNKYVMRMKDGINSYNYGKDRYMKSGSQERLVDGIDMIMSAICSFVEELSDYAETNQEKEIIRKHLNKMKNI